MGEVSFVSGFGSNAGTDATHRVGREASHIRGERSEPIAGRTFAKGKAPKGLASRLAQDNVGEGNKGKADHAASDLQLED